VRGNQRARRGADDAPFRRFCCPDCGLSAGEI